MRRGEIGRAWGYRGHCPVTTATRTTAHEFLDGRPTRWRQLVDGVVVVDEPRLVHQLLQARLLQALLNWIGDSPKRGIAVGPIDVQVSEHDVYGPDLSWISHARRPLDLRKRLAHVPDLCAEIRSPGTWHHDVGRKKALYERARLPELWLVDDVAETILVYRRSSAAAGFDAELELRAPEALASPQLPGFVLALERLFALE